jgi:ArsR family transcriptional regulator
MLSNAGGMPKHCYGLTIYFQCVTDSITHSHSRLEWPETTGVVVFNLSGRPQGKEGSKIGIDANSYFCKYRNMVDSSQASQVARYADMFSAMGTEARLRIMQLLLAAHPGGLVVTEIQKELDMPNSTLSHHLDKLKHEGLIQMRRESTFLRYTANTEALREILQFLYAECCTRNGAVNPQEIVSICK